MPRNPNNKLETWEIQLVKAMIEEGTLNDQDILAWFTRPTRSINHARIKEIRDNQKHKSVTAASKADLARYRADWPHLDPKTGLHIVDDELLIKSREAMLSAVQGYNNPTTTFKSEIFIVTVVIAWTYLLHWHFGKKRIDYLHKKSDGSVLKTKHGADKHWELDTCLGNLHCPLDDPTKENLRFLIEIRHEIEHQMTLRIDETISAKLQACCLNYNRAIKALCGDRYGLDGELGFALQFSRIEPEQRNMLLKDMGLPANIVAMQTAFEASLSEATIRDSRYAYRVALVEVAANSRGKADRVIEFVKSDGEQTEDVERVIFKLTEKPKLKPAQIVKKMQEAGFSEFKEHHHSNLWKSMNARDPKKGYGVFLKENDWWWYENWLERVQAHCEEHREKYT